MSPSAAVSFTEEQFADLCQQARHWAAHDPDPITAGRVNDLVDDAAAQGPSGQACATLASWFHGPLTFGTAGLRGAVNPGQSNMNRAVVIRATKGLIDWLNAKVDTPVVVIGCDARHGSHEFAHDAAGVVAAAGGRALLLPEQLPTPVTAFAVRALGADAGIMVTASHNPPQDNGYKVYLGGRIESGDGCGAQLVSPSDAEIQQAIAAAGDADTIARDPSAVERVDVLEQYLDRCETLGGGVADGEIKKNLRIVLTPMHGVGGHTAVRALARAGFTDVHLVAAQAFPDPDFPTVAFPNPEEPGALDLAMATARAVDADIIIALDPDADRCAVAVPDDHSPAGWRQLSGDDTGSLLGDWVLANSDSGDTANSVVSSRMLGAIAHGHGRRNTQTLTGFKWIARSPGIVFGYEEAIGFCTDPEFVRDKDGVTCAIAVACYAATMKARGLSLVKELRRLRETYGYFITSPLTFRVDDVSLIAAGMERLLSAPPATLAGSPVVESANLADGYLGLPPTTGMVLVTEDNARVIVRPSGTEPKLKCYLEVVVDGAAHADPLAEAHRRLDAMKVELREAIGL